MSPANVDLKQTLNLPRTNFSMKANLPQAEPKMLARWAAEDLYGQIRKSRKGKPVYILHDGPPYANGRIHLGTAFNKIVKDFIVKSQEHGGFRLALRAWLGLPRAADRAQSRSGTGREKGADDRGADPPRLPQIRRKVGRICSARISSDWACSGAGTNPYLTMNPKYQAVIAGAFVDFLDKGYAYKGLKPVNWCMHDRTALAEAEVEYENHKSPSVWVRFALTSDPAPSLPHWRARTRLRADLDHYAMDAARQPGNRLSSEI